ncbi:MAG TPA: hypothetical protein PLH97_03870 [Verrucomicrobiota bacterium]|nr:hypothetical protein [Verrucomicrobiota bacterium]HPU55400.1 hypothetical protein [Verrucomicrobiota bacterium]
MTARNKMTGISRIEQPEKRTFGYFVRLQWKGKIYNGFFPDKRHGGKKRALEAAQKFYRKLLREHGPRTWHRGPRKKKKQRTRS